MTAILKGDTGIQSKMSASSAFSSFFFYATLSSLVKYWWKFLELKPTRGG